MRKNLKAHVVYTGENIQNTAGVSVCDKINTMYHGCNLLAYKNL